MFLNSYRRRLRSAALMREIVTEEGRFGDESGGSADDQLSWIVFRRRRAMPPSGPANGQFGSNWRCSGPPSFAHECRRRMPRRSVATRRGGGPVRLLNELRLGKPSSDHIR